MLPLEERLINANPWWANPSLDLVAEDPHIRRYTQGPVQWDPPALTAIDMTFGDTHTLRGPRQVGKTTTVKRMIQRLLKQGKRRIMYFSCDQDRDQGIVHEVIWRAKQLYTGESGPWYIFLDEITSVPDWQYGIKYAFDSGLTDSDAILLTGSSAHDLKRGAERLPGRRGAGEDYLQLPMSFRDFCHVTAPSLALDKLVATPLLVEEFLTEHGQRLVKELYLRFQELERQFRHYITVGGFPSAVRDFVDSSNLEVHRATLHMLWSTLSGDIAGARRDPLAAAKLMQTVGTSLGSPFKWASAAEAMSVDKPDTARQYTEFLAETFMLLTVYYWDIGKRSLEPKKQRKVYFIDPVLAQVPARVIPGTRQANESGLIENLVAVGLFRSAAHAMVQSTPAPGAIAYWRSTNDREVDFVVPCLTAPEQDRFPVEVKGDNSTELSHARLALRNRFHRGLLLSRTTLDLAADVPIIPVHIALAALRDNPLRDTLL